ncbi:MAG: nuclear transport factor 2 family protein [Ancrocorticia sp.]
MTTADTWLEKIAEIFSSGDVRTADAIFAENYRDHQKPDWITYDGPAEFIAIVESARASLPNLSVRVIGGPYRCGQLEIAVLQWFSEAVDGTIIERETVETIRCEDEKVVEHWGTELRNITR